MDRVKLSHIDEELESTEVAALCFLCRDVVQKKRLEGVQDAKDLFLRLEERGLLDNSNFLSQLLNTIRRADLLTLLETDSRTPVENDASPTLSAYRVMLYKVYEDMTMENFEKMKFLLSNKLGKKCVETSNTSLDLFAEMEKTGLLSKTNLYELQNVLQEFDQQLASVVQNYIDVGTRQEHVTMDFQRLNPRHQPAPPYLSISETQPGNGRRVYSDAESLRQSPSLPEEADYYPLNHNPRGWCVVINNEKFTGLFLKDRRGTDHDERALSSLFSRLGFEMKVYNNLTADEMRSTLGELSTNNFMNHDALVVCVLSHGEKGCVYGTDEQRLPLAELTKPFTSGRAPTLAGKPKLFFIQACQGNDYERGFIPTPLMPRQEENGDKQSYFEEDAGQIPIERVPSNADFLLGMATVPEYMSFRHTSKGSIYIQELCKQLEKSAQSSENDDILTILTRVNREVSRREDLNSYKQMPEPKYTLTKKLVLKYVI
ncbi:Caspase-8 [Channa argus]|uniref:Caspase-8 n=1 Tax=Channa argus TaxID=215402 RepID=A0A6G1Q9B5_CHAAH|nr:Caspase-8 [Channa argus]